ncbi:MAG TPA: cyclic nucleotide-binding domain-containing protein [Actinomycetes bacterium]|nr:cyclic nucleotide-binding domain-containing protein [Actinomycetes bacterium]
MTQATPDDLRHVPLLSGLDDRQLQVVASHLTAESYRSGQSIVREGDVGYSIFIIKTGRVDVTSGDRVLRQLGPGDFFGELGIVSPDGKRTATVTARDDAEVWTMLGTSFRQLELDNADVAEAIQVTAQRRLSEG